MAPTSDRSTSLSKTLAQYVISPVIVLTLSVLLSTRVNDYRISTLEAESKEVRAELREINSSISRIAVSLAELSQWVRDQSQKR
jgi:hypothetical protein